MITIHPRHLGPNGGPNPALWKYVSTDVYVGYNIENWEFISDPAVKQQRTLMT